MARGRPPSVQITRHWRADDSVTFSLRVRMSGNDETVALGNSSDGWDEVRAERARRQLLARIELGLWNPAAGSNRAASDGEPTLAELTSDWLADRERNPAIRAATTADDRWKLKRYLIPFFGDALPSQITPLMVKQYRRRIHEENEQIRAAREADVPLLDPRTQRPLRPLSNESINKTLRTPGKSAPCGIMRASTGRRSRDDSAWADPPRCTRTGL